MLTRVNELELQKCILDSERESTLVHASPLTSKKSKPTNRFETEPKRVGDVQVHPRFRSSDCLLRRRQSSSVSVSGIGLRADCAMMAPTAAHLNVAGKLHRELASGDRNLSVDK